MPQNFKDLWPLFVLPKEDELLSSWMTRNAHNHAQKIQTFYQKHLKSVKGNSRLWIIDIDRSISDEIIEMMAAHIPISKERILSTSLKSYEGKLFEKITLSGNTKWILPQGHRSSKHIRHSLLYCPTCLAKDEIPYFRKRWRLSLSFCCPDCGTYLRETCGICGSDANFIRTELGMKNEYNLDKITNCYKCGEDLRDARAAKCNPVEISTQRRLYKYLEEGHTDTLNYSHLYFDALYYVCAIMLSNKAISLQKKVAQICNIKFKPIAENQNNKIDSFETRLRGDIIIMATWLLDNWPERFLETMKETESGVSIQFIANYHKEQIPFWYTAYTYSPGPILKSNRIIHSR